MSYLDAVRLHFAGSFQADVSTVNNDVRHFDNQNFKPAYQQPSGPNFDPPNGWWNPDGTGSFRLVDCRVTEVCYADGSSTSSHDVDPVVGMWIADSNQRVGGKLVDLDPQQQMVSEIWGMTVRLFDGKVDLLRGEYVVAGFTDIWNRAVGKSGDMGMSAMYQSVLRAVAWGDPAPSRFLRELAAVSPEGLLSIKFNVDGYNMTSTNPRFTLGRVVGTIGPASKSEPRHFVLGRQLLPTFDTSPFSSTVNFMVCAVDGRRRKILADFGNALPTTVAGGSLQDIGVLRLGYMGPRGFVSIDQVPYREDGFYAVRGGVAELPAGRDLTDAELAALGRFEMAVAWGSQIVLCENFGGWHARADQFVQRVNPGEPISVDLWATQLGKPIKTDIVVFANESGLGDGTDGTDDLGPPPPTATPTNALAFPDTVTTGEDGKATLVLKGNDPGTPRGYIDGQVYGVGYLPKAVYDAQQDPQNDNPNGLFVSSNPSDIISVLLWSSYAAPASPTWYQDIQPITQQYANLYPIMGRIVNMGDYASVVKHRGILQMAFGLPPTDPNYMPVTRDLSPAKQKTLLQWLATPTSATDPNPLLGTPPATPPTPPVASLVEAPAPQVAASAVPAAKLTRAAAKAASAAVDGSKSHAYSHRRRVTPPKGLGSSTKS